jgi:hypothetical protein
VSLLEPLVLVRLAQQPGDLDEPGLAQQFREAVRRPSIGERDFVVEFLRHGLIGAAVAAWPAVALVGSYELLMLIIRGAQSPEAEVNVSDAESVRGPEADPLQVRATGEFAGQIASGTVPSIRAIRARQPRAQQIRAYLAETVRQTAA